MSTEQSLTGVDKITTYNFLDEIRNIFPARNSAAESIHAENQEKFDDGKVNNCVPCYSS